MALGHLTRSLTGRGSPVPSPVGSAQGLAGTMGHHSGRCWCGLGLQGGTVWRPQGKTGRRLSNRNTGGIRGAGPCPTEQKPEVLEEERKRWGKAEEEGQMVSSVPPIRPARPVLLRVGRSSCRLGWALRSLKDGGGCGAQEGWGPAGQVRQLEPCWG